ncbi:MAG: hypothetical protein EHM36_10775 [Deltaproteobacteria bacterium]|nr:MAG: hypothetical protein EHM36_10775 [Deltaproteobacteria bacterium]
MTVTFIESFAFSFTAVFFPLVITTFLIERATKTIEEHKITDALYLLFTTIAMALLLAVLGEFILALEPAIIYAIFAFSFLAVIAVGNYKGLRLSELLRFRFLRKDHAPH